MDKIQVFIADDHRMMREGLSLLLNSQPDIEVIGEAFDPEVIKKSLQNLKPDILLLDTALIQTLEIRSIVAFINSAPETKTIMMSSQSRDECVHQALNDGARGFIVKQAAGSEVANAIRQVMYGHYYLSPVIMSRIIETYLEGTRTKPRGRNKGHNKYFGFNQLSEREKEVFHLLLEGRSSKEISLILNISPKTADKHRTSVYKKTSVENSTQLLHYAISLDIISTSQAI